MPVEESSDSFADLGKEARQGLLQKVVLFVQVFYDVSLLAAIYYVFVGYNFVIQLVRTWAFIKPEHLAAFEDAHNMGNYGVFILGGLGLLARGLRWIFRDTKLKVRKITLEYLRALYDIVDDATTGFIFFAAFLALSWIIGFKNTEGALDSAERGRYEGVYFWCNWTLFACSICVFCYRSGKRLLHEFLKPTSEESNI